MFNTIILQPPLVQLNTPYPSGAYLSSLFKKLYNDNDISGKIKWFDLSNLFFRKIFSKSGIEHIFTATFSKAQKLIAHYESLGDNNTAFVLTRFLSQKDLWASWIDRITAILSPKDSLSGREFTHEFVLSAHVPRGPRMEQYLLNLGRDVTCDDAVILASLSLADLQDYISLVYDNNFSLIRYAEHLATSTSSFDEVLSALDSPSLNDFLKPVIEEILSQYKNDQNLFCISVPFPGCFTAACFLAKTIKTFFSGNCVISFGGGYINTELREIRDSRIFDFCDFISFDKGYGTYSYLIQNLKKENLSDESFSVKNSLQKIFDGKEIYGASYFSGKEKKVIKPLSDKNENYKNYFLIEHSLIKEITPDYSDIDFTKYPRLADDVNPMHRIWNDGAWIKAYLAHGCYWHRCAFCDTTLDYVKDYCLSDTEKLYDSLYCTAEKTGVHGIHFVDEACPPKSLIQFALKNLSDKNKIPLTFWGNIRFEKSFTRDSADLLSHGGLTAVSAGIEIATGQGLDSVNKGTDIKNIIHACCAFKEAGILIHSYMIFGFWNQSEQDLIDSMETLRQMFKAGLLDSAFWHKFTLTKHSTVYREWLEGKHKDLIPLEQNKNQFAENEVRFKGEEKSEKYSAPLNAALDLWMHGKNLSKPVTSFFAFKMPRPSIAPDFVESLIQSYETERDFSFTQAPQENEAFVWLGGVPVAKKISEKKSELSWFYMGELFSTQVEFIKAEKIISELKLIRAANFYSGENARNLFNSKEILKELGSGFFTEIRGKGLCKIPKFN